TARPANPAPTTTTCGRGSGAAAPGAAVTGSGTGPPRGDGVGERRCPPACVADVADDVCQVTANPALAPNRRPRRAPGRGVRRGRLRGGPRPEEECSVHPGRQSGVGAEHLVVDPLRRDVPRDELVAHG